MARALPITFPPMLQPAETRRLLERRDEPGVKQRIIEGNLRLVKSIAEKFPGLPLEDAFQEGVLGMEQAITRFDLGQSVTFSVYATWWIRKYILSALSKLESVRFPQLEATLLKKVQFAFGVLLNGLGRTPTAAELARETAIQPERIAELMEPRDVVPLEDDPAVHDTCDSTSVIQVGLLLSRLPYAERTVIKSLFGLDSSDAYSVEETAGRLGISADEVRSLEASAMQTMRAAGLYSAD